ncbi:MAG TPA: helix-turn-helix transcriptional regulator [Coleofasciculaceae cyanobacterium]|jgi:transcriptional regulator with XRE-family HTH domain
MISDRKQFCFRLKQARLEAKLKQEVVARYLQIPVSAVSSFESGNRKLDSIELFMLAKLYQKPMEWFFNERPDYMFIGNKQSEHAPDPEDPLISECFQLLKNAPRHLQKSAAYGVIGFLSER